MRVLAELELGGKEIRLFAPASEPMPVPTRRMVGVGRYLKGELQVSVGGEEVTVAARIGGRNLAYAYVELFLEDPGRPRFYGPLAREHVRAQRETEVGGLLQPDWGEEPVEVVARIRANQRLLTDGVEWALFCPLPGGYGETDYELSGLYAQADGAAPFPIALRVDHSGAIRRVVARKELGKRSLPRVIRPSPGDRLSPYVEVVTRTVEEGNWETTTALGASLTFSEQPWYLDVEPAAPGRYLAGFVLQDLDGRLTRHYAPFAIGQTNR